MTNNLEEMILAAIDEWLSVHKSELIGDITALVNIKSVQDPPLPSKPFGEGPARVFAKGEQLAQQYGFSFENDENYTLSFLFPGKTEKELGIMGHVDVVPEGNDWVNEPYNARLDGEWLIGRGTGDNKGPSVAALYTLRFLKDIGASLNHTLRIIWGGNEETGMLDAVRFDEMHNPPPEMILVCDAAFPLCYGEKGILQANLTHMIDDERLIDFSGGIVTNAVPDSAYMIIKADFDGILKMFEGTEVLAEKLDNREEYVRLSCKGVAGHAAFPANSVSAIQKLAKAVSEKELFSGLTGRAIAFIAGAFSTSDGSGLGINITDDIGSSTTHIGGYIRLKDRKLSQNINVRYAIRADVKELIDRLTATVNGAGFSVEDLSVNEARYDSLEDPKIKLLMRTAKEFVDPDAEAYLSGGGTHARKLRNAVPYGPGKSMGEQEDSPYGSAHAHDEAVYIPDLLDAIKVYAITLVRLDELLS